MNHLCNIDLTNNRLDNAVYTNQPFVPGGRLTLTSGTPVTSSDVTGASTLYYTPYLHDRIALYDGTRVVQYTFTEQSVSLSGLTSGKNYDIYAYVSSGSPAIAIYGTPWSSDTARSAYILAYRNGYLCVANNQSQRYIGTIRTTGTTTTEDSLTKRFLWNNYNRVDRALFSDQSVTHTYTTGAWRAFNNGTNQPRIDWIQGQEEDTVNLTGWGNMAQGYMGLTVDSTSTIGNNRFVFGSVSNVAWTGGTTAPRGPALGYHYATMLEYGGGASGAFYQGIISASLPA